MEITPKTRVPFEIELEKPYVHRVGCDVYYETGGESIGKLLITRLSQSTEKSILHDTCLDFEGFDLGLVNNSRNQIIGTLKSSHNQNYGGTMYDFEYEEKDILVSES